MDFILLSAKDSELVLAGNKTSKRILIKPQPEPWGKAFACKDGIYTQHGMASLAPYRVNDIIYVKEPWKIQAAHRFDADVRIEFMAGGPMTKIQFSNSCSQSINRDDYDGFIDKWLQHNKWHSAVHMPKEAARIFLRITEVRAEQLQDITEEGAKAEGAKFDYNPGWNFMSIWNSTVNKSDLDRYGWEANPWVFVIRFQRETNPTLEPERKC